MKIALLSTYDSGGAGKAALRLSNGLNNIGENCNMFVKYKSVNENNVIQISSPEVHNSIIERIVEESFINNIHEGNTISSIMYPSVGVEFLEQLKEYDVINLHWISMFVSLERIVGIEGLGKPIVWTLHDQNPMTGACHYARGCEKYMSNCSMCPQLVENGQDITRTVLKLKQEYISKDIVVVTPSRWLAECARKSRVFGKNRIEVIPNSVDTEVLKPIDKAKAKETLGYSAHTKLILFGANDLKERRKGTKELIEAMSYIGCKDYVKGLLNRGELSVLTFGHSSSVLDGMNIPYHSLGYISDEEYQSIIYSAADVLALPSLEDNLPNTILESFSCGTPVVGFETGGMVDAIYNNRNGYLVPLNDIKSFGNSIIAALKNDSMSDFCRESALEKYRLDIQGNAYKALYEEIISNKKSNGKRVNRTDIPIVFPQVGGALISDIYKSTIEAQKEINNLKDEKIELSHINQEQGERLKETDREKTILNGNIESLKNETSKLNELTNELKYRLEDLQKENSSLNNNVILLNDENNRLVVTNEEAQKEISILLNNIVVLTQEKEQLIYINNEQNSNLEETKKGISVLMDKIETITYEKNNIYDQNIGLRNEKDNLNIQYTDLENQKNMIQIQYNSLVNQMNELYKSKSWKLMMLLRKILRSTKKVIKFILPYAVVRYYQKKKYNM